MELCAPSRSTGESYVLARWSLDSLGEGRVAPEQGGTFLSGWSRFGDFFSRKTKLNGGWQWWDNSDATFFYPLISNSLAELAEFAAELGTCCFSGFLNDQKWYFGHLLQTILTGVRCSNKHCMWRYVKEVGQWRKLGTCAFFIEGNF